MLQLNCRPAAFVISVLRVCAASGSSEAVSSVAAAAAVAGDSQQDAASMLRWPAVRLHSLQGQRSHPHIMAVYSCIHACCNPSTSVDSPSL